MAGPPNSSRLILPIAPLVAGIIGVLTAAMFALVPIDLLESMVVDSGIAAVLSAAEPPLGMTARLGLVLAFGGGVGLLAWFGLFLAFGARTIVLVRSGKDGEEAPVLRRADAHPDAPARRPLFANTDLGTPFLEVRARPQHVDATRIDAASAPITPTVALKSVAPPPPERPLPNDLDQPLAAFDPAAVPDEPLDWVPTPPKVVALSHEQPALVPVASVSVAPVPPTSVPVPVVAPVETRPQTFDPAERFETFALTPMVRPAVRHVRPAARESDPSETVQALLERLERVAARREMAHPVAPPPHEPLEDALTALRRMAIGRN